MPFMKSRLRRGEPPSAKGMAAAPLPMKSENKPVVEFRSEPNLKLKGVNNFTLEVSEGFPIR